MLKGIDPLLNADVLHALRAMGHGDDLVLCDTNFPADSVARATVLGRLLRIDNVTAARAARAVLSVMPLDSFVDAAGLADGGGGQARRDAGGAARGAGRDRRGGGAVLADGQRSSGFAFYERAQQAYCVIATGERRFYGCFIFKKGVIAARMSAPR